MKTRFLTITLLLSSLIVSHVLGAAPEDFELADRNVFVHSDPAECADAIDRAIEAAEFFRDRPEGAILRLIGDGGNAVTHPVDRPIVLPSNIAIVGVDGPVIGPPPSIVLSNGNIRHQSLFRFRDSIDKAVNVSFRDFRIDLSADRLALQDGDIEDAGSIIFVNKPFDNLLIQDIEASATPLRRPLQVGNTRRFLDVENDAPSTNLRVRGCQLSRVRRFVYLHGSAPVTGVLIADNEVRDVRHSMVQLEGPNEDIIIIRNIFRRHAVIDGNTPGHMISTSFNGPVTKLRIRENQITGIPNAAFERTVDADGVRGAVTNGGSADLVAIRNVFDFQVTENQIWYSGELGMSVLDRCSFGLISQNDIRYCDGAGLVIGSAAFFQGGPRLSPVDHITVADNNFEQNGQDESGDQRQSPPSYNTLTQIRIWNAEQIEVIGNRIRRLPLAGTPSASRTRLAPRFLFPALSGIWLFDNNLRGGGVDGRVIDFLGCGNVFSGYNLRIDGEIQDFSYVQGKGLRILPEEASRDRENVPDNRNTGWSGMIRDERCRANQWWRVP